MNLFWVLVVTVLMLGVGSMYAEFSQTQRYEACVAFHEPKDCK
jgi:hypothetical protein